MPETLCCVEASDCPGAESPQLALVDGVDLKVLEGLERTFVFDAIGFKHIQYECPCEGFAMELRKCLCCDRYFVTRFVKWVLLGKPWPIFAQVSRQFRESRRESLGPQTKPGALHDMLLRWSLLKSLHCFLAVLRSSPEAQLRSCTTSAQGWSCERFAKVCKSMLMAVFRQRN